MDILLKLKELAAQSDLGESGYVAVSNLKYYQEVRDLCKSNACGKYGTSWACPPATGTIEECKERADRYDKMLLFSAKYDLEDSFDFEGMIAGLVDFKQRADRFEQTLKGVLEDYFMLSNEGCRKCETCTYPTAPCRFPETLHHSLEGYGFVVNDLAKEAGLRYNNGPNTVTYFGGVLFHEKK